MALKASDFPTAAANVFLGFSIMVIGLMFRDRFAANLLYVTDNKDVIPTSSANRIRISHERHD
jgi:hypothetical protein